MLVRFYLAEMKKQQQKLENFLKFLLMFNEMGFSIHSAHKQAQITCIIIKQIQIFMSLCVHVYTAYQNIVSSNSFFVMEAAN